MYNTWSNHYELEIEGEIMLNDDRINFLRREADPCYKITGSSLLISLLKVKEVEMGGCWWFRYCCKCGSWWSQRGSHHPWYNCRGLIYNSCRKSGLSSFHRGLDFETRLRDTHANAPRFNFLRDSSGEYHKYYQHSLAYYSTENTS